MNELISAGTSSLEVGGERGSVRVSGRTADTNGLICSSGSRAALRSTVRVRSSVAGRLRALGSSAAEVGPSAPANPTRSFSVVRVAWSVLGSAATDSRRALS